MEAVAKILIYFPSLMILPVVIYGIRLDLYWQLAATFVCVLDILVHLRAQRTLIITFVFLLLIALLTLQHQTFNFSYFGFVSGIISFPLTLYLLKRLRFERFNQSLIQKQFALFLFFCVVIMVLQSIGYNFEKTYGLINNAEVYNLVVAGGRFIGPFGLPAEAGAIGLLAIAAGLSSHIWYFKLTFIAAGFVICFLSSSKIFVFGLLFLILFALWRHIEKTLLVFLATIFSPLMIYLVFQSGFARFNLENGKVIRGLRDYTGNFIIGDGFFGLERGTDSVFLAVLLGGGIAGVVLFLFALFSSCRDVFTIIRTDKQYFYVGGILISFFVTLPGTFILWTERVWFVFLIVMACMASTPKAKRSDTI